MTNVNGFDCTGANLAHVPASVLAGQAMGYISELPNPDGSSSGIKWTDAQLAAHPGVVRIDQSPNADNPAYNDADVFDVEAGAITIPECPGLYQYALTHFEKGDRPGQRRPAFYVNRSNLTPLCNEFVNAGIKSGPRLIIAAWGISLQAAQAGLDSSGGPFPVVGYQIANSGTFDTDVFLEEWLNDVSQPVLPPVVTPPAPVPPKAVTLSKVTITLSDGTEQSWAAYRTGSPIWSAAMRTKLWWLSAVPSLMPCNHIAGLVQRALWATWLPHSYITSQI